MVIISYIDDKSSKLVILLKLYAIYNTIRVLIAILDRLDNNIAIDYLRLRDTLSSLSKGIRLR